MKIMRLTRHDATAEQLAQLQRIYGSDIEVVKVSETVPNAARVVELAKEHSADVVEAVLPLPILADLLKLSTTPVIRAITRRELKEDGSKTEFVFSHYERYVRVVVETEPL